jgi:hypothetical protein
MSCLRILRQRQNVQKRLPDVRLFSRPCLLKTLKNTQKKAPQNKGSPYRRTPAFLDLRLHRYSPFGSNIDPFIAYYKVINHEPTRTHTNSDKISDDKFVVLVWFIALSDT